MPQELDRKRVQDFARKLFGRYTSGMLTLMVELGYRSGLFEAAAKGPAISAELAERAGLDERYVREWLAGMTRFDLITTFDAIHDQRDPATVLRRIAAALATDGVYLMLEPRASSSLEDNLGNPFAPYVYGISVLHGMTVSLAEGGTGLGTAWGEQLARRMLADAGFRSVETVEAPGPQNTIFICRK